MMLGTSTLMAAPYGSVINNNSLKLSHKCTDCLIRASYNNRRLEACLQDGLSAFFLFKANDIMSLHLLWHPVQEVVVNLL